MPDTYQPPDNVCPTCASLATPVAIVSRTGSTTIHVACPHCQHRWNYTRSDEISEASKLYLRS